MATCPHCGGPAYPDDPCDCNAARLETLLADNQEATHEVAVWRNRYEDLKAALRDKDTALAESEALVMNHEGHISRLEDELEKLQGRLDDSEAENGNLGEECGHLEEELERLKLYESEHERLKVELNRILHPAGDGPKAPSFCDLVAYVESDLRKLREREAECEGSKEIVSDIADSLVAAETALAAAADRLSAAMENQCTPDTCQWVAGARTFKEALAAARDLHQRWMSAIAQLAVEHGISTYDDMPGKWYELVSARLNQLAAARDMLKVELESGTALRAAIEEHLYDSVSEDAPEGFLDVVAKAGKKLAEARAENDCLAEELDDALFACGEAPRTPASDLRARPDDAERVERVAAAIAENAKHLGATTTIDEFARNLARAVLRAADGDKGGV